jgi:hypothetical protein
VTARRLVLCDGGVPGAALQRLELVLGDLETRRGVVIQSLACLVEAAGKLGTLCGEVRQAGQGLGPDRLELGPAVSNLADTCARSGEFLAPVGRVGDLRLRFGVSAPGQVLGPQHHVEVLVELEQLEGSLVEIQQHAMHLELARDPRVLPPGDGREGVEESLPGRDGQPADHAEQRMQLQGDPLGRVVEPDESHPSYLSAPATPN